MKKILFAIILTLIVTSIKGQTQNNFTHTVQRGETIELIAQKYGVSVDQIKQINPNMDIFFTGLKIQVPAVIESASTHNNQSSNSCNERTKADNTNSFHSGTDNVLHHIPSIDNNDMLYRAAVLESEGKNNKALKIYKKVAKTNDDAEVWFRYGRCCYNAGKWKEAIKALESVPYKTSVTQEINKSAQKILAYARTERENQLKRRSQFWASVGETFLTVSAMAATTYAETKYDSKSSNYNNSSSGTYNYSSVDTDHSEYKNSSQRNSTGKICRTCKGDGKCISCHGEGVRTDNYFGTGKDYSKKCGVCGGKGTCGVCNGTGHQN